MHKRRGIDKDLFGAYAAICVQRIKYVPDPGWKELPR
jgi:hypothetical protein